MRYYRNRADWIMELAVTLSLRKECSTISVLSATAEEIDEAKALMRIIGIRVPGDPYVKQRKLKQSVRQMLAVSRPDLERKPGKGA